ncbi:MAG: DUF6273 domain-containing protein [Clostridiales bacterium]|nr:DUF6273 domain-containing protein [Clostridiales bacterium]
MAILKCKMCGGDIELSEDKTFGTCDSCGSVMTFPKIDDEQRAAAFNRGNHFRRLGEFDKALQVYEKIVEEDDTDAEAHWCCALCRFGIEYVEDPTSFEYVPTCHRASFDIFTEDVDYLAAVEHSDGITQKQYMKEGARISAVQRGILATSQNEKPFDVFICYKESDDNGQRTVDSTLAQDIYYQLTDEGLRVFFARITLEDKAGSEYEPYIFAALNSAKVMLVVGTKPEHFNAVWVKNEWSRYLSIVKHDRSKVILPCYRDMDPYDLPEQLSVLQSYDMSKIGFIQDLIRGIKKIAAFGDPKEALNEPAVLSAVNTNIAPLLERAFLFLEDGKWQDANIYCEKVLDIDPKKPEAYLGKLMAELHVKTRKQLSDCAEPFDNKENYSKVIRFGDQKLETEIRGYIEQINERNEKIEHQADAIAKAIQKRSSQKDGISLQKQLSQEQGECSFLQTLSQSFDGKLTELQGLENQRQGLNEKINQLKTRRQSLGIFAGKEKAQIDTEMSQIQASIGALDQRIASKSAELRGFASQQAVDAKLQEISEKVTALKARVEENLKSDNIESSYIDAIKLYRQDQAVKERFKAKYPNMVSSMTTIMFGQYPKAAGGSEEPIEWEILDEQGDKILLISKYALDCKKYNGEKTSVTWETCTLRTWLNTTFLNATFSPAEQGKILTTLVSADKNPEYNTDPGNDTNDKVFLLSINEVNEYFSSDAERECKPTKYAVAQGADIADRNGNCSWWLRSPGRDDDSDAVVDTSAAFVDDDGDVYSFGLYVNECGNAVRPALWINLESE